MPGPLSDSESASRRQAWYERYITLFPPLDRQDRLTLVASLTEGSRWNLNFGVMLGCSVLIAGLGLLQNSVAVIIGAMLVAPLMTPLIGTGLALVQGNFKLLGESLKSMLRGVGISLLLGVLLRLGVPGSELTPEISLRGAPNILDLGIAFLAGVAAGYALARPNLSGALPGVAISVALVPPLAASGLALGSNDWLVALGALLLFATNLVAIVLGSALVFRMHGIRVVPGQSGHFRMKRIILGLGLTMVLMTAPLAYRLADQLKQGQAKAESLTLSESMWNRLHNRVDEEEGIDFLTGVRPNAERPEDVVLLLTANRTVPGALLDELDELIDDELGEDVVVKIAVVQQGTVTQLPPPEEGKEEQEPVIND